MSAHPPCPLVLSLLATGPRRAHEVARALGRAEPEMGAASYSLAMTALECLRGNGLVRARVGRTATVYQITARGQSEPWLQCRMWASLLRARPAAM